MRVRDAGNIEAPVHNVPVVVYGGFSPCPDCGHIPREYAHFSDGHVVAYHVWLVAGREIRRFCELQ